jgi:erythromycin esterase-like protein
VLSAYLTALHQYRAGQMYAQYDGRLADDETFVTEIEHHAGAHARDYYRLMLSGHEIAWNLREQEMVRTLAHLAAHLRGRSPHARIVIWGHNAHIGDLRATERSRQGERSLGELARARYGDNAVLIGFDTHHGTLTAAADWGVTPRTLPMPPALPASYEALFHEADLPGFWLRLRDNPRVRTLAAAPHLERAVGAVFAADSARDDRYLTARLAAQFDALVFLDETHAVVPLES